MNIAETCLNNYGHTRQQILQSRLRFLSNKNKKLQSSVGKKYDNFIHKLNIPKRRNDLQKIKKRVVRKLS